MRTTTRDVQPRAPRGRAPVSGVGGAAAYLIVNIDAARSEQPTWSI
jgi:hypothetical protein